jgi:hypothetical protein
VNDANKKSRLEGLLERMWIPFLAAAALLVGFSVLLISFEAGAWGPLKHPPGDKVWDWWIGVVGTLLSFIVGLVGAAWHLRARRRAHLRRLVRVELDDLCETLKGSSNNTQHTSTYIHPLVIEEAIMSGLFTKDLSEDMLRLLKMYQKYDGHTHSSSEAEDPKDLKGRKACEDPKDPKDPKARKVCIEKCITYIRDELG